VQPAMGLLQAAGKARLQVGMANPGMPMVTLGACWFDHGLSSLFAAVTLRHLHAGAAGAAGSSVLSGLCAPLTCHAVLYDPCARWTTVTAC
jgi:hypothetical protein